MDREYIQKWANEILQIARSDWNNLVLLEILLAELKHRSSNAGLRARKIVEERIAELTRESAEGFQWPSTDAPAGIKGFSGDQYWYQDGLLSYVGYRVGKTNGVSEIKRRRILDCVLFNELPLVNSPEYMNEWGEVKTSHRLKKLAEALASFTRNAKRKNPTSLRFAIDEWESDLSYLYHSYYHERLGFYWPESEL